MYSERETKEFIKRIMIDNHKGKDNQINYGRLKYRLGNKLDFNGYEIPFTSKDSLRAYINDLFENEDMHTLVSTATGVFVAANKQEIIECAQRLRQHALGELKRYAKLMKLPNDYQLLIDLKNLKIKEVDRTYQQALFDTDETLYEISKDREDNV